MIRTTQDLSDRIAAELVWRRKELTDLRGLAQENRGELRSRVVIRSAVALLYAHWEGFVKKSSSYYLEYVSSNRLTYERLAPNFVALTLKAKFAELGSSEKVSAANAIAEFFCHGMNKQANVPFRNVVDTKSNLSSKVLEDIILALGLGGLDFSTRHHFIDSKLVSVRNHVAHGEFLEVSLDDYLETHDTVMSMLETYRNSIENAAVLRTFERVSAMAKDDRNIV